MSLQAHGQGMTPSQITFVHIYCLLVPPAPLFLLLRFSRGGTGDLVVDESHHNCLQWPISRPSSCWSICWLRRSPWVLRRICTGWNGRVVLCLDLQSHPRERTRIARHPQPTIDAHACLCADFFYITLHHTRYWLWFPLPSSVWQIKWSLLQICKSNH